MKNLAIKKHDNRRFDVVVVLKSKNKSLLGYEMKKIECHNVKYQDIYYQRLQTLIHQACDFYEDDCLPLQNYELISISIIDNEYTFD